MRISLAQLNPLIGDLRGNSKKIISASLVSILPLTPSINKFSSLPSTSVSIPIINPTPKSANIGLDDPISASPAARLTKMTPIQARI